MSVTFIQENGEENNVNMDKLNSDQKDIINKYIDLFGLETPIPDYLCTYEILEYCEDKILRHEWKDYLLDPIIEIENEIENENLEGLDEIEIKPVIPKSKPQPEFKLDEFEKEQLYKQGNYYPDPWEDTFMKEIFKFMPLEKITEILGRKDIYTYELMSKNELLKYIETWDNFQKFANRLSLICSVHLGRVLEEVKKKFNPKEKKKMDNLLFLNFIKNNNINYSIVEINKLIKFNKINLIYPDIIDCNIPYNKLTHNFDCLKELIKEKKAKQLIETHKKFDKENEEINKERNILCEEEKKLQEIIRSQTIACEDFNEKRKRMTENKIEWEKEIIEISNRRVKREQERSLKKRLEKEEQERMEKERILEEERIKNEKNLEIEKIQINENKKILENKEKQSQFYNHFINSFSPGIVDENSEINLELDEEKLSKQSHLTQTFFKITNYMEKINGKNKTILQMQQVGKEMKYLYDIAVEQKIEGNKYKSILNFLEKNNTKYSVTNIKYSQAQIFKIIKFYNLNEKYNFFKFSNLAWYEISDHLGEIKNILENVNNVKIIKEKIKKETEV